MPTRANALRPGSRMGETLQFMQRLWELAHALEVRSKRMRRTMGITGPQRLTVRVIGQNPGVTATALATTLGVHPSTLTGIVARLERDGLIVRQVDPRDGRRACFRLTAAGREANRARRGTVEAAVGRALASASRDDIRTTEQLLQSLVHELEGDA